MDRTNRRPRKTRLLSAISVSERDNGPPSSYVFVTQRDEQEILPSVIRERALGRDNFYRLPAEAARPAGMRNRWGQSVKAMWRPPAHSSPSIEVFRERECVRKGLAR